MLTHYRHGLLAFVAPVYFDAVWRRYSSTVGVKTDLNRNAVNIELSTIRRGEDPNQEAQLVVEQGAEIVTELQGEVTLESDRMLIVNGLISAPAGIINLKLAGNFGNDGFLPDKAIWLGSDAQLLARGYSRRWLNNLGIRQGQVFDAGNINITTNDGFIVTNPGSMIDVSGVRDTFGSMLNTTTGSVYQSVPVFGKAGSINLTSADGMFLNGDMMAHAASMSGAAGGSIIIEMDRSIRPNNSDEVGPGKPNYPAGSSVIEVRDYPLAFGDNLQPGDPILGNYQDLVGTDQINNDMEMVAYISTQQINRGGFDIVDFAHGLFCC